MVAGCRILHSWATGSPQLQGFASPLRQDQNHRASGSELPGFVPNPRDKRESSNSRICSVERSDMTTLANQLPRISLANGGSMQSAQVVTLKSGATGPLPRLTQNRQCTHGASYKLNTSALLPSHCGWRIVISPATRGRLLFAGRHDGIVRRKKFLPAQNARTTVTRSALALDLVIKPSHFGVQYSKVRDDRVLGRLTDAGPSCLRDKQEVTDNGLDSEHNRSPGVRHRYSFLCLAGPCLGRTRYGTFLSDVPA